ncbi:hepatocyte growth factor-regulated tyrosine kinase substrate [Gossypium australe]|uniref:Hepatocyte growth factor-regulated tyrosine kinase substrate n=1 Tax=Gossypium australe TaxID=47621 RepID=A0A5B6VGJ1_9ROSI|nr:hepatocyte growth factor-regulated tyrosine kinase substrate [Gossypium australe]
MSSEPPPFQEAPRCDVCKCSFNTFRRRLFDLSIDAKDECCKGHAIIAWFQGNVNVHTFVTIFLQSMHLFRVRLIALWKMHETIFILQHHCRCCGRTLCHEHSSDQMPLPQFGILSSVRVCADCFNNSSGSAKADPQPPLGGVGSATDEVARLNINADVGSQTEATAKQQPVVSIPECKCGMPLCICESPAPKTDAVPLTMKNPPSSVASSNPKPKKTDTVPKSRGSTSNSKSSSVFNPGLVTNGTAADKSQTDYDVNGEGLREAIKNGDTAAVKRLLSEGVDANYRDKQGLSVLHLAALFNRTDIVFALMDYGASMDYKNAQGN